jgi:hypothetical protein
VFFKTEASRERWTARTAVVALVISALSAFFIGLREKEAAALDQLISFFEANGDLEDRTLTLI